MKILLINPKLSFVCRNPRLETFSARRYLPLMRDVSLSLLTVAGCTPPGIDLEYADENFGPLDFDRPADLVGIHVMTSQVSRAYEIAAHFHRRGVPVILGGPHPSVLPEEAGHHADAVVVGEAEGVWAQCVEDARTGRLKAVYAAGLADLARSPIPRYDLIGSRYVSTPTKNLIPVQFSRGCPRNCAYCSVSLLCGRKIRFKAAAQIAREVETIASLWPEKELILKVLDANPFADLARAREQIRAIGALGMRWTAQADVGVCTDRQLLRLLRRSGCVLLGIGFESLDPDTLGYASPWKRRRLDSYAEAVHIVRDHDIIATANFMLGFQRYGREALKRMRDFVVDNELFAQFFISTPFPGTRFYEDLIREKRLFPQLDWRFYNGFNLVYEMGMTPDEVAEDLAWLYEQTWAPEVLLRINASIDRIWGLPAPREKGERAHAAGGRRPSERTRPKKGKRTAKKGTA